MDQHNQKVRGRRFGLTLACLGLAISVTASVAQVWVEEGPGPMDNGQVEGLVNGEVVGAVHAVAPHPTNPAIVYVGAANGGIWMTSNATAAVPTWTNQTPDMPSLSIGDIKFDPTDASNMTLVAGSGRFSSLGGTGGARTGLLRTTNGGATWTPIDGGTAGLNITGVAPRGSVIVVSSSTNDANTCGIGIHRSTDSGTSFVNVNNGLPSGSASALGFNPINPAELYVDINTFGGNCGAGDGVYRSTDTGATWTKVSDAATMDILGTGHFEIAMGTANNVFVSITPGGQLGGVFLSVDGGASWTQMDLPTTNENGTLLGIHPGSQGDLHNSIAADPFIASIVYVGGDRQGMLPNSIGAQNFTGRLFRGDASQPSGSQWTPITHSGTLSNSAPHADSRAMAFDAAGNLIQVDDGGVYKRTAPRSGGGDWLSMNGNLKVNEMHNASLDRISNIIFSGNQDTGSSQQTGSGVLRWDTINQGDGGDTTVGIRTGAQNFSDRYSSSQNLGQFQRQSYDAAGNFTEQDFPDLMFVDGARVGQNFDSEVDGQFITPVEVNAVNPLRLIISGSSDLYETMDRGATLSERAPGLVAVSGGIRFGAQDNENILYVGGQDQTNDGVFVATTAGTAPAVAYVAQTTVVGVAMDPDDSTHAFAIEPDRVVRTTDTGGNFANVTGNLGTFDFGELRSIIYMNSAAGDAVAVGGTRGVYIARGSSGFSTWAPLGTQLPNVPVFDLDYNPLLDVLVAGTLGRGALSITGVLLGGAGNNPPTAQNDSATVAQGGTVTMLDSGQTSLLANDSDPDMDNLTVNTTPVAPPANGNLTLNANGTFSYAHNNSMTTTDSFVYQACDDGTPSLCANGTVNLTITPVLGDNCRAPNAAIPDGAGQLTDTLTVTDMGTLTDLNVSLNITHTYVGDLTITLTHVATATNVALITTPGGGGCDMPNIAVMLDDAAATAADAQCAADPAIAGTQSPTGLLADFNGEDFSGDWTLTVADSVADDTGTLDGWCLIQTTAGDVIFADGFEN